MNQEMIIQGGFPLKGTVRVKGAKNAGLPIIAGALLLDGPVIIDELPDLLDVRTMLDVISSLGVSLKYHSVEESVTIDNRNLQPVEPDEALMQKMRASFLVLGPLLARFGQARIALPGGCAIGSRPVDLHLKGLEAMGVRFAFAGGLVEGTCDRLHGADIYLDYPSVGATENLIMAAVLARGTTTIENAASEPEIVDLANFLNSAGARISGAGTKRIRITGVEQLGGTRYAVIPDRIEAGTFLIAAAVTGGELRVSNVLSDHLKPLLAKLRETGMELEEPDFGTIGIGSNGLVKAVDLKTQPYPGFPTDLQPQFMVLIALASGTGMVSETVFENRFRHISGLVRMGADIRVEGSQAVVQGVRKLSGAPVEATDLRGAAALILAALAAEGESRISGLEHFWRGYSAFERRLQDLGARLSLDQVNTGREGQAAG